MTSGPRRTAVAGTFYPAEPVRLDSLVAALLAGAAEATRPEELDPAAVAGILFRSSLTLGAAMILAGGSGTRLWPLSRAQHPQQDADIAAGTGANLIERFSRQTRKGWSDGDDPQLPVLIAV